MDLNLQKGMGHHDAEQRAAWNVLREELSLPAAVLSQSRLRHNLAWMREFIAAYGLRLAPHGKTTMAPRLFQMQLQNGAWGITLATAQQVYVAWRHGVRRILMANQLVGKENMAIVARLLDDPAFDFYTLVESAALADQLGAFFADAGKRLQLLLELGVPGGRAGIRDDAQLDATLAAIARWPQSLALAGVEIYEGVLDAEDSVSAFAARAVALTRRLLEEGRCRPGQTILSGAGSAWYDVVADVFAAANLGSAVEIVLRPGCYLTHDVGIYRDAQQSILERNPIARRMHGGLLPALEVWACVQSLPEPGHAIVGMGKRDAAFDAGLPVPVLHFRPAMPGAATGRPTAAPTHWSVTKMMDQHAYLSTGPEDDLRVGDMIGFHISHPCLTFDKWRAILIVDDDYNVIEIVETFF